MKLKMACIIPLSIFQETYSFERAQLQKHIDRQLEFFSKILDLRTKGMGRG